MASGPQWMLAMEPEAPGGQARLFTEGCGNNKKRHTHSSECPLIRDIVFYKLNIQIAWDTSTLFSTENYHVHQSQIKCI